MTFIKVAALSGQHAFQASPEGSTLVADVVFPHAGLQEIYRSLQIVDAVVWTFAGNGLDVRPHTVVERVDVW